MNLKLVSFLPALALAAACSSAPESGGPADVIDVFDDGEVASQATRVEVGGGPVRAPAALGTALAAPWPFPPAGWGTKRFLVRAPSDGPAKDRCVSIRFHTAALDGMAFAAESLLRAVTPDGEPRFCRHTWRGRLPVPQAALSALARHAAVYRHFGELENGKPFIFDEVTGGVVGDGSTTEATVSSVDVPRVAFAGLPLAAGGSQACPSCVQVFDGLVRVVLPPDALTNQVYLLPSGFASIQRAIDTHGAQAFWATIPSTWSPGSVVVDW